VASQATPPGRLGQNRDRHGLFRPVGAWDWSSYIGFQDQGRAEKVISSCPSDRRARAVKPSYLRNTLAHSDRQA